MKPLRDRLQTAVDDFGLRINKVAEHSGVKVETLYRLRAGTQMTLNETDSINLHEYLKTIEQRTEKEAK